MAVNNVFYVYTLYRPWDGVPCYVGKGKGQRWQEHDWAGTKHKNKYLANIYKKAERLGLIVTREKVAVGLSEADAFSLEIALIARYKRTVDGGSLVNRSIGGEGFSGHTHTKQAREKIAEAMRTRVVSAETREKMRAARLGVPRSEEAKKKTSASVAKSWKDPEVRERRLAALRGRPCPPEVREKIRQTNIKTKALKKKGSVAKWL